jgi:hypothetical protein
VPPLHSKQVNLYHNLLDLSPIGLDMLGNVDNSSCLQMSHILMVDSVFQHRTIASTQC